MKTPLNALAALAAALALAAPAHAAAQSSVFGFRIGLGFPMGAAADVGAATIHQDDLMSRVVPLQADLLYRIGPVDLGGYLSYGFVSPPSNCPGNCDGSEWRLGLQAMLHSPLRPERELWAGILFGWQRVRLTPGIGGDAIASGWEGGLQGGYDFAASGFGFGPYVQITAGQYGSLELDGHDISGFDRRYHETFRVGLRGFFKL